MAHSLYMNDLEYDKYIKDATQNKVAHSYIFVFRKIENTWRVLLVQNKMSHKFGAPGGKVEANETFKEAAVRELREEVNIELSVNKLNKCSVYVFPRDVTVSIFYFYFAIEDVDVGSICTKELLSYNWFTKDSLKNLKKAQKNAPLAAFTCKLLKFLEGDNEMLFKFL